MDRRRVFSAVALAAVVLASAGDSVAQAAQVRGDAARGRVLFASKGCVICHAINQVGGTGGPPLGAEGEAGEVDALDFVARMWRGAEAMIFMQQQDLGLQNDFTGQELADILAFIHEPTERRKLSGEDFPALLRRGMRGG